jgi:hypothetical protein
MKKFYAILCLAIASLTQLHAQAPQGFNYQATVRNSAGDLIVNTNVYFKFNVIQGSQTAVPIFTETHYVPTDDLGQVNLVIGQGTANTGIFSELDWSLGSYYLGIELNTGSGYVAMGTTQLLSVPYALYAENSGNAPPTTPNLQSVLTENNSAGQQQIKDLLEPTDGTDAVTKAYVDALSNTQGLMNFNGWDNYQVWNDGTSVQLTPNSFVFVNANDTTLIFPDGPENCCFGDVIYVYVMDGQPATPTLFNLQANGFPVAVGGGDEELVWTSSEIISGEFNSAGLKTIINVGDYWMIADFQGSISNNLTAQVNPIDDVYVCPGYDVAVNFSTTNTQGTTQYLWTNDNDLIGIPLSGISTWTLQSPDNYIFTNPTSEPQVATITVTPQLTFQGQTTTGSSETFTITVNPLGQVNQVDDITVNSGETVQPIIFTTSNSPDATSYTWTNDNSSLGLPSSGSGNIPSFSPNNTSTTPIVGTITVTPTFTNGGVSCVGLPISFTITVNPANHSSYSDTSSFSDTGAPSTFTKKVLLEEFTGTWVPQSPPAASAIANAMSGNSNIFGVGYHASGDDPMEIPETSFWSSYYNVTGFPTVYVNGPDTRWNISYMTQVNAELAEEATVGLAVNAAIVGGKLDLEVSVGFKSTPSEEIKLMIYLAEDNVTTTTPQAGSSQGANYVHRDVLREVYTDQLGDVISSSNAVVGGVFTRTITGLDLPSNVDDVSNLKLIAFVRNTYTKTFVDYFNTTHSNSPHYDIYNVQEVHVGETQAFD